MPGLVLVEALGVLILAYCIYGVFYRLCLSPLAKIPGPRLAALTLWYEVYYDLVQESRFPWKIKELHDEYGPIVRVGPNEVHINDTGFAEKQFFSNSLRRDKFEYKMRMQGMPKATSATIPHDLHKERRKILNSFFSQKQISLLYPHMYECVEQLCSLLENARKEQVIVNLRTVLTCFTSDVVTMFTFGRSTHLLESKDYADEWRGIFEFLRKIHLFKHFPFLRTVLRITPHPVLKACIPKLRPTVVYEGIIQSLMREQIIVAQETKSNPDSEHPRSIFREIILDETCPPSEKNFERLWHEAKMLVAAGTESTSNILCVVLTHFLLRPDIMAHVVRELEDVMPNTTDRPSMQVLEGLPYFTASVQEGLRMSLGLANRFTYVYPEQDLEFQGWKIPAGTAVSMSALLLHHDEQVFPDSEKFLPERWLDGTLSRAKIYTFAKGSRGCIGINMAYAEIYITLAMILRRFKLELYETTAEDVKPACDAFNPFPLASSKGVRVLVV